MTRHSKKISQNNEPLGFKHHDHGACVSETIATAEARCDEQGLRFTPVRRRVLEILLQEHRALGAYAILDQLREDGFGSQPTIAYRALDFLVSNGLAHKIERLNAFIACVHPDEAHTPAFMICRVCETVAEAHSSQARAGLGDAARAAGFQVERTVVEAEGICPTCQDKVDA
jgi:Fur family zinc uptake transcriptional regulator